MAALLSAAALTGLACSGGGGGSPTAPPVIVYAQIAGNWSGEWVVVELGSASVQMTLSQSESVVTGTLSSDDVAVAVQGTLSARDASGGGVLTWEVPASALDCGYVRGTLVVSQGDAKLEGPATISTVGCEGTPETHEGPMTLAKMAGAAATASGRSELTTRLARLLRSKGR